MKLEAITIRNYRSIEDLSFPVTQLDDSSFTYGFIGVNEAGKSSILKALALKDELKNEKGEKLPLAKDFKEKSQPIEVNYVYTLSPEESRQFTEQLTTAVPEAPDSDKNKIVSDVTFTVRFNHDAPGEPQTTITSENFPTDSEHKNALIDQLNAWVAARVHKTIFWTAEDRYLISQPINLSEFANDPNSISIPLKNCFSLIGVHETDISNKLALLSESTEREFFKDELGKKVTEHINRAWPNHKIKITFDISDGFIYFHVNDLETSGRAKTADQRSDGFRQFISFLLTISAQSKNEELVNSVLLLDEPETHLHPQAQEDLLKELIQLTQTNKNNICFFATHSNYMIDKQDLSRTYRIVKAIDKSSVEKTQITAFDKTTSSYAGVTYEVFEIPSTDYHNELYAKLHELYQDADTSDTTRCQIQKFDSDFFATEKSNKKDRPWKENANSCTLSTYIRNCIHHPDNGNNYSPEELKKSIELMRSYL